MSAKNWLSSAPAVAAIALTVQAQVPTPRPSFEVAAIKRNVTGSGFSGNRNLPGGRVSIENQRLRQIIRSAYGSSDLEVIGGPDWVDNDRWDILATGQTDAPELPWREMVKTLLEERFKLRVHVEQRERPIYGLVFGRADKRLGSKIHLTTCTGGACGNTQVNTVGISSGSIAGTSRTLTEIGRSLSPYAERRVFDRTGLDGRYDFELTWSEDVSFFTAVQEQLGLKLEAQRGPVEVVVIDSVDRPVED
jgi:uncharacterized protein (TIGR03435 family)